MKHRPRPIAQSQAIQFVCRVTEYEQLCRIAKVRGLGVAQLLMVTALKEIDYVTLPKKDRTTPPTYPFTMAKALEGVRITVGVPPLILEAWTKHCGYMDMLIPTMNEHMVNKALNPSLFVDKNPTLF
jgi:hypothetical protein